MAIVLAILLVGVARMATNSWTSIPTFLASYWAAATIVSSTLLELETTTTGAALSMSLIACISVGYWFGSVTPKSRGPRVKTRQAIQRVAEVDRRGLRLVAVTGLVSGLLLAFLEVRAAGFRISDTLSLDGLFNVGHSIARSRYDEVSSASPIAPLALAALYATSAVAGAARRMLGTSLTNDRLLFWLPSIGAVALSVVTTGRTPLALSLVFWISGYCAASVGATRSWPSPTRGSRSRVLLALSLGWIGMTAIAVLRAGSASRNIVTDAAVRTVAGFLGGPALLGDWFQRQRGVGAAAGADSTLLTINGALTPFGFGDTVGGIYDSPADSIVLHADTGTRSNIYTAARPLVEDFGLAFGLAAAVLFGIVLARSMAAVARRPNAVNTGFLMALAAYGFWFPVTSLFAYTSTVLAVTVTPGLLVFVGLRSGRSGFADVGEREKQFMERSSPVS